MNTKRLAEEIAANLGQMLGTVQLAAVRSVYISGSYCRGDWLDHSSDLDVNIVLRDTAQSVQDKDIQWIQSSIEKGKAGRNFPSQCPGGVDLGLISEKYIPKTQAEASIPSPYSPFSTTMFDLKAYHLTLYGEDPEEFLPPVPVPSSCAGAWLRFLCGRQTDSSPRAMFGAYKAVTAAQLHFGEPTLNKYRMLELYQRYVPDFPDKPFGEQVIRNYIGSFYPERPPLLLPAARYAAFMTELERLVESS
jgi:hypothetical protein